MPVPLLTRAANDTTRIMNRVLVPLLTNETESRNDEAAKGLPSGILQWLDNFIQRQEQLNKRLEQRILAFEKESHKGRCPDTCPKCLR